jgi:hypothetical protein
MSRKCTNTLWQQGFKKLWLSVRASLAKTRFASRTFKLRSFGGPNNEISRDVFFCLARNKVHLREDL